MNKVTIALLAVVIIGWAYSISVSNNASLEKIKGLEITPRVSVRTIIKQTTDDRGLTSVVFRHNGEEWALDYLTKREYDSLFTK